MTPKLQDQLEDLADEHQVSVSAVVRWALSFYIKHKSQEGNRGQL